MKLQIPKDVEYIINKIYDNGYEAFIVGGCVRDSIIGLKPNDYDITTSAKPNEIMNIFKNEKIIETGIKHGTVTLIKNGIEYEITTYRIDGEYNDNRRPDFVEFTNDINKDLQRRDFTINAIAYNHRIGIVDTFDGIGDIHKKIIKTVGKADERFNEDGLRIIRAVRFSCKLGFDIEKDTLISIYKNINLIKNVSIERIQNEFNKILLSDSPENLYILYQAGMFDVLNFNSVKINKNELKYIKKSKKDLIIRLSMFTYITGYIEESKNILNIFRYSNKIKKQCSIILDNLDNKIIADKVCIKLYLNKIGKENLSYLLYIKKILKKEFINEDYDEIYEMINDIERNKECYSLDKLAIDGSDLRALGYAGKDIGQKLDYLLKNVIENPKINNKIDLISIIRDV
ncbi:CCA tRNA nucleotidyltransferase [[Eubacterium] tenue]|nr:CCA tRNA nucleotidyltransferase [[Eubacterium] tenue]MBC8631086.1 CCA tRNA nucleotidyltransferase [[Eubacterium] tenue]